MKSWTKKLFRNHFFLHCNVLVPVEDARQGSLLHLLHRYPSADAVQPQLVCRLTDAQQGHPFGGGKAVAGKGLDGELLSVMLAYHRQASDAALHGVVLSAFRKIFHQLRLF